MLMSKTETKPNTKIMISQNEKQRVMGYDLVSVEWAASHLYHLACPIYVLFNEDSAVLGVLKYARLSQILVIKDSWSKENIQKQLEQRLAYCSYIVMFTDDTYPDPAKVTDPSKISKIANKVEIFREYAAGKEIARSIEFSLDMLRSPTLQTAEVPADVHGG